MDTDNAWNKRSVDYTQVHGESPEAYSALVKNLRIKANMTIGDIMSGYGAVSKEILEYCGGQSMEEFTHRPLPVRMVLTDRFDTQLRRSVQHLSRFTPFFPIHRVIADTRSLPLAHSLDAAVIKHGLHELPREDHASALKSIHNAMCREGSLFVWEMMGITPELTELARDILRMKDKIAGYTSLVRNRYFPHSTEIYTSLEEAGFKEAHDIYVGPFIYETKKFLAADLQSNPSKLEELNQYIRERTPTNAKDALEFTDNGESVTLTFVKKIIQATA